MEVRDPIHGGMLISTAELTIVDNPWIQRLRNIRQTGFSHRSFPGATHTRYGHSLGVMYLAGRAFDSAYEDWVFDHPEARVRLRQCLRMAALCHDLGHPPFSHCMEFAMPELPTLGITWYRRAAKADRTATHEDYTIAILERTGLTTAIDVAFPFTARHVAALISGDVTVEDDFFMDGGLDHRRLLSQIVSSELDVDRLDYLVRDATYTGARYGMGVDVGWLLTSLSAWPADGQVSLALDNRAIYAFDHFLIARHHMFLMVYFHHKSVIYERLLKRYVTSDACDWRFPDDLEAYQFVDDVSFTEHLRRASDPLAKRIVEQLPYRRVLERHGTPRKADVAAEAASLEAEGIDTIVAASTGKLSRYRFFGRKRQKAAPIYVLDRITGQPVERVRTLAEATQIFERYADERRIARLYVPPEDFDVARKLLGLPVAG